MFLECHPESLNGKIERRVEEMLRRGFVEEAKNLCLMCPSLANAIGYREMEKHFHGSEKITERKFKEWIVIITPGRVKKQKLGFESKFPWTIPLIWMRIL
jgi:tRNA A37 N6-isopentenylltransferase MiaA